MSKTIGTQPMVNATAYHIGLGCPMGQEVQLLLGLRTLFPELPQTEARDLFLEGLADRFRPATERVARGWDGKPKKKEQA